MTTSKIKALFPEMQPEAEASGFERWLTEKARQFRAAYPAAKRNTHVARLLPAMRKVLAPLPAERREHLFAKALDELAWQAASERWEDAAYIPHMASWWNGRYWEHDRSQYRPRIPNRESRISICDRCGHGLNAHMAGGCYNCVNAKPPGVCVDA